MAGTVRYEWLDEPANQDGKHVVGWIDVQTEGDGLPAKDRISIDEIVDWEITFDGKTIRAPKDGKNNGVEMLNQNVGRNEMFATDKGLFLIGEVGSYFRLINYHDGVPPNQPSTAIMKAGIHGSSGPLIAYRFYKFTPPWKREYGFRSFTPNNEPMGFDGNAIQIGVRPQIDDGDDDDEGSADLAALVKRMDELIAELRAIQREIKEVARR